MAHATYDRPSDPAFLTWVGIGGLFAMVFVTCGGIGAFLGTSQLRSGGADEGLAPSPGGAELASPNDPPAQPPIEVVPLTPAERTPPERAQAEEPRPPPPAAPAPAPAPEPEEAFEVETDDLIDPWAP